MKVYKRPNIESQVVDIDLATHAGKTVNICAFPAGTLILDARVSVTTAFTSGCTAALNLGATSVVPSASVDSVTELKSDRYHKVVSGNNVLSLTLGAADAGVGFVTVVYVLPTKVEAEY